jgi:VIT1/CCC1 family predicted Fe2+/Mn2+ transporter
MVLTITCSFSIAEADRRSIHTMLVAALGCNLAWGLIDAVFHLIARLSEQARGILALQALRRSADPKKARTIIGHALPPMLAAALTAEEFDLIQCRLNQIPKPPMRPALTMDDWPAAAGVFLLVFVTTLPVVFPFLLIHDPKVALRASNGVAVLMLFFAGYALGRYSGRRPWLTGLAMVLIGGALVGITIGLVG